MDDFGSKLTLNHFFSSRSRRRRKWYN